MRTILLGFLALACSGHDMMDDMREGIAAGRAENARHHERSFASTTVDGMLLEVDRHEQSMDSIMTGMHGAMDGMSHCTGSGVGEMWSAMGGMHDAMGDHRAGIEAATDLAGARAACAAHAARMDDMLDQMDLAVHDAGCM